MALIRQIDQISEAIPTMEGAGVHLNRAFGFQENNLLDPFLLLDDFRSDNPDEYKAGFPWHPHRGIETITYMLDGEVKHEDSLGNGGIIGPGEVQWMTAGSGIIHQEMPQGVNGIMGGLQLWANLPASHKMMDPRYRDVKKNQIPEISVKDGIKIKIISGLVNNIIGPVQDVIIDPQYLDVIINSKRSYIHEVKDGNTIFAYVLQGKGFFDQKRDKLLGSKSLIIYKREGNKVEISTKDEGIRFLLISGKPIGEPVAWYGPIVMNTKEELQRAFEEYHNGTFLKY